MEKLLWCTCCSGRHMMELEWLIESRYSAVQYGLNVYGGICKSWSNARAVLSNLALRASLVCSKPWKRNGWQMEYFVVLAHLEALAATMSACLIQCASPGGHCQNVYAKTLSKMLNFLFNLSIGKEKWFSVVGEGQMRLILSGSSLWALSYIRWKKVLNKAIWVVLKVYVFKVGAVSTCYEAQLAMNSIMRFKHDMTEIKDHVNEAWALYASSFHNVWWILKYYRLSFMLQILYFGPVAQNRCGKLAKGGLVEKR